MAKAQICFGFLTLAAAICLSLMPGVAAVGKDCSDDLTNLATKCLLYVSFPANPKFPPSKDCCGVISNCDMQCVCSHITKEIEKLVCMEKVVYVAATCGRPLAKGTKCGSYEVPPLM